jgi:hypothetical protein
MLISHKIDNNKKEIDMKKILKYTTCSGFGTGFEKKVQNLLEHRYQPYGEPKVVVDPNSKKIVIIKVMVKYEL